MPLRFPLSIALGEKRDGGRERRVRRGLPRREASPLRGESAFERRSRSLKPQRSSSPCRSPRRPCPMPDLSISTFIRPIRC